MPIYQVNKLKTKFKSFLAQKFAQSSTSSIQPAFGIVLVGSDFASEKYIQMKLKMATELGIEAEFFSFESDVDKNKVRTTLEKFADKNGGLIFQLPIRADLKDLVDQIPAQIDVDLLGLDRFKLLQKGLLPPTIGAIDLVLKDILGSFDLEKHTFEEFMEQKLDLNGLNIAIVGQGVLVGWPLLEYLKGSGASLISLNEHTQNIKNLTQKADILISATGVGGLIDETWLKASYERNGHLFPIVIDAGTSEGKLSKNLPPTAVPDLNNPNQLWSENFIQPETSSLKTLVGDADTQKVQDLCTLVAVPGGVGPITVRYIFWNLYCLSFLDL